MTSGSPPLPEPIARGIQGLRGLEFIDVTRQPPLAVDGRWEIEMVVKASEPLRGIPGEPRFVVTIEGSYPSGSINFFPAIVAGIEATFPHQDRNVLAHHKRYRLGKPCLDSSVSRLSRLGGGPEPVGDPDQRLAWHASRVKAWLEAAITNSLMDPADPFELPLVPFSDDTIRLRVVHDEGADTWPVWRERLGTTGLVEWSVLPGVKNTTIARRFMNSRGETVREFRHHLGLVHRFVHHRTDV